MTNTKTEVVKAGESFPDIKTSSPDQIIMLALNNDSDLDKVAKILEIKERWEAGEARKAFHIAMAAFKSVVPVIKKNKSVGYESTRGGSVGYKHATLDNIVDIVTPLLSANGLSISWKTAQNGNKITVTCKVTHKLGHSEDVTISADPDTSGSKNQIQAIGSAISYLERYTLIAALGIATKDQGDDDGRKAIAPDKAVKPSTATKPTKSAVFHQ